MRRARSGAGPFLAAVQFIAVKDAFAANYLGHRALSQRLLPTAAWLHVAQTVGANVDGMMQAGAVVVPPVIGTTGSGDGWDGRRGF